MASESSRLHPRREARRRERERSRAPRAAAGAPRARRPGEPPARWREAADRYWVVAALAAVGLLAWAGRNALFGVPAADDYVYLHSLRFDRPLDLFGSMGAPYYWRPLSRQAYYAALAPALLAAPWVAAAVHALLLVGIFGFVYRVARRAFPAPVALGAASFPLLAEPARVLLVWPTGSQYLLPMLAVAAAVHEALAGRRVTAGLAGLAAVLSHEAAVLVLPALPLVAWAQTRSRAELLRWAAVAAAVAALWLAGRTVAHGHGVQWLALKGGDVAGGPPLVENLARVAGRALAAQLNLEDMRAPWAAVFTALYAALVPAAVALAVRDRRARARLGRQAPALAGAAAWLAIGIAPLALLLPDWEAWRTSLAALWLGVALVGGLALVRGRLALAFVALRVVALFVAPPAPAIATKDAPSTTSGISLAHVVRWQRTAHSAHRALRAARPALPRGASVGYWSRIAMTEVALEAPKAFRVWYGDSTVTWNWYWDPARREAHHDAVLVFEVDVAWPAVVLDPQTLALGREALAMMRAGQSLRADSLFLEAYRLQSGRPSGQFSAWILSNRARIAYEAGDFEAAASLSLMGYRLIGATAETYAIAALLAIERNELPLARESVENCLALDAKNAYGLRAARKLGMLPPEAPGDPGGAP